MLKKLIQKQFFIVLIFSISLFILLVIGLSSFLITQSWVASRKDVVGQREILLDFEKLFSFVKDAEAGQRGYLLAGDSLYLFPYQVAIDSIKSIQSEINSLPIENENRKRQINKINLLVENRLDSLKQGIEIRGQEGLNATVRWILKNKGRIAMDSLRQEVQLFHEHESNVLENKASILTHDTEILFFTQIVGSLISIALLVWAFLLLREQMERRKKDLEKLEEYSSNLEKRVQDRTEDLEISMKEISESNEELNRMVERLTSMQHDLLEEQHKTEKALAVIEKDNERKTKELEDARTLQLSMLPQSPPDIDNLEIATYMKTCVEVGGDYYDYKIADDGTLTLVVGDATGHGLRAGIVVATVKSYFQTLANTCSAVEMLQHISEGIRNLQIRAMYMGLTVIQIKDYQLTIASSGMPPAYLYHKSRSQIEQILLKGMFLGSDVRIPYRLTAIDLHPGDTLLLMTDGLPELFNKNREMLDYSRIENYYQQIAHFPANDIITEMVELGNEWSGSQENEDDITMVVIKVK